MNPRVRAVVFDMDGCIYSTVFKEYLLSKHFDDSKDDAMRRVVLKAALLAAHRTLLDRLKDENKNFDEVYVVLGSNRQSKSVDLFNKERGPSCFPVMQIICDYLSEGTHNTHLEPMLLADIEDDLELGTSFEKALNDPSDSSAGHSEWRFDTSKITIVYSQAHKIACDTPGKEMTYDFWDDNPDVLNETAEFYKTYSDLLPEHVTVNLHLYAGKGEMDFASIKGTAKYIDSNYRKTTKELAELAAGSAKEAGYNYMFSVADNLLALGKQKNLYQELKCRILKKPEDVALDLKLKHEQSHMQASQLSIQSSQIQNSSQIQIQNPALKQSHMQASQLSSIEHDQESEADYAIYPEDGRNIRDTKWKVCRSVR